MKYRVLFLVILFKATSRIQLVSFSQCSTSIKSSNLADDEAARKRAAKKAEKEAKKQEEKEKKREAQEIKRKENAEKKEIMAKGRKAAGLASKTLPALTEICKAITPVLAEATAAGSNLPADHPQILSIAEGQKELEDFRKAAAATLSAQAKCSGKPLPLLPFESEKFINTKVKAMKDQVQALKLLMHPKKSPRKSNKRAKTSLGQDQNVAE